MAEKFHSKPLRGENRCERVAGENHVLSSHLRLSMLVKCARKAFHFRPFSPHSLLKDPDFSIHHLARLLHLSAEGARELHSAMEDYFAIKQAKGKNGLGETLVSFSHNIKPQRNLAPQLSGSAPPREREGFGWVNGLVKGGEKKRA
jgi:hypothetical protein